MNLYHTTDTDGITELNPSPEKMRELLDSLDDTDAEEADHPDVSLIHDSTGWALSVFPSGVVTFENLDEPDGAPRYMSHITRNQALKLWLELSRGEINQVKSRAWIHDGE
jgi:hypothetical protein